MPARRGVSGKARAGPTSNGGAHVCLLFLVFGEARAKTTSAAETERTEGNVVGPSISHPAKGFVEHKPYTNDDTYGFTSVVQLHLLQAYYRYPSYNGDGSPYGGAGLQMIRHHYFRGDGGVYRFGWTIKPGSKAKGFRISY